MRITNKTMSSGFLRNLNRNLIQMQKYQNQLSSGKEVSRPSDDPMAVSKIMDVKNNIKVSEQYNKNITDTIGWVDTQDTALTGVTKTLQRVRELVIYGANDALSDSDRDALLNEVKQSINGLRDILNVNFDGRYVFGGQETKDLPFSVEATGLEYNGNNKNITREISKQVEITLVTSGEEILGGSGELRDLLNDVLTALDTGDTAALSGDLISRTDERIDAVLGLQSRIGSISNRLNAAKDRNEAESLSLKALLSQREDVDIAEKYMEYNIMSNVYQASLSVGSKILQPGLLDFLR